PCCSRMPTPPRTPPHWRPSGPIRTRRNCVRRFLNKLTCVALSLTFLMGCMATPAFAYSGEETGEDVKAPSVFETEEEPVTATEQNVGPLTPEGNLTVVDDYQTTFSDGTAQQFITLVSKSGAYFYLIIDRA